MSVEHRDWYRDWWRKKTGYVERALFRRPAREVEREREVRFANWHPVLKVLAGAAAGVFVFVVLRAASRFIV